MYEKLDKCPCCQSKDLINHIICDDHTVSHESFAIMRCSNCNFLFTSPRPNHESIGQYYQSEDYVSHTDKANNLTNFIYKIVRKYSLKKKYNFISKLSDKQSILDYGCGTGEFLKKFQNNNWEAYGVEPNENARQIAQQNQVKVTETVTEISESKFGIITLWHVLEHVHDINETISTLRSKLSKKGKLVVAVPNHESYDQKYYKAYWAAYDVPRHLYHFDQSTIKTLMQYNGFQLIDTKPMPFDAYYVSLLSEEYKKGKLKFMKAFLIGWLSNRWARKNNKNYSSLIYVFKKA